MTTRSRLGVLAAPVVAGVALTAMLVWTIGHSGGPGGVQTALARDSGAASSAEIGSFVRRAGLSAETLAAAGLGASGAGTAVDAAARQAVTDIATLRSAEAAFLWADAEHGRLLTLVERGQATAENRAAFTQAVTTRANALAQRDAALAAVAAAADSSLTPAQRESIARINANASRGGTLAMGASDRGESRWLEIRNALANERISGERGVEPDAGLQQILSAVRSEPAVASAQSSLTTNLAAVQVAWQQAVDTAVGR